jgi:hypothetical protein
MTGFESFDVRVWVVDGLVLRISRKAQPSPNTPRRAHAPAFVRWTAPLAAAVAGFSLVASSALAARQAIVTAPLTVSNEGREASDSDRVPGDPHKFWSGTVVEISTWRKLPELDTDEPEVDI